MSSYNTFALFYDRLTENVEYQVRSEYISNFFSQYNKPNCKVLDLACGTGSISRYLCEKGYMVYGIDLSEDMLTVASSKQIPNLTLLKGDMRQFELPEKVDACVCSLDAINHLTSFSDVSECFGCVNDNLNENGIFIFDVNTQYKHREVLFNNTFVFDEEDFYLVWDNCYLENDIVEITLDLFVFNGKNYDRYFEQFSEKAYSVKDLKEALVYNNFEILGVYDELTENQPREDSERLYFVCRKV